MEDIYNKHLLDILNLYLTPAHEILEWDYIPAAEKLRRVTPYLNSLKQRSVESIASRFVPRGGLSFKVRVVGEVLQYAEKEGDSKTVTRQTEIKYRNQVYGYHKMMQGKGATAQSLEKIIESGGKGGRRAKELQAGILAQDYDTRVAARAGAEARGQTIYSDAEKELIQSLVKDTKYQLGYYNPPRPNWGKIAAAVTETYGVERTKMSVRKLYEKMKGEK